MRDVVFTILAIDEASRTFRKVGAEAEGLGAKLGPLGKLGGMALATIGVAAAAAAVEGTKLAMKFQSSMEQLATQAHVPQKEVDALSQSVLKLSGRVGEGPDSLGEALYHIESSFASVGIKGPEAMHLLETASKGAKIGHADLVDVTNALDAAVASGIPGAKNFDSAMGALNATVGAGDMKMQDLADAFSTGLPAIAKAYGVSLREVGGALAVFGDLNIRGQVAATDLRMAIMDMTKQAKPGQAALKSIGITSGELGKDMQKGGLNKALIDLHNHLDKAGLKGAAMGRFLEDAFTKKSSAPMAILLGNFDRFQGKLKEVDKGAKGFGDSWKEQQATLQQQWDQFKGSIQALLTELGLKLIPLLEKVLPPVLKGLGVAIDGFSGAWDRMIGGLQSVRSWLQKTFGDPSTTGHVNALKTTVVTAFHTIWDAVGPALQKIWTTIQTQVVPAFVAFVKALIPVVTFLVSHLAPVVRDVMQTVGAVINAALKMIAGLFNIWAGLFSGNWSRTWSGIKQIFSGAWDAIKAIFVGMVHATEDILAAAGPALWAIAKRIGEGIKAALRAIVGGMVQIGKDIVMGVVHGIEGAAGAAVDAIKGVAGGIKNGIAGLMGISSPAKKMIPIGRAIIDGITVGLRQAAPDTYAEMRSFALKIADLKVWPAMRDSVRKMADHLGSEMVLTTNRFNELTSKMAAQKQAVADLFKKRAEYATQLAQGIDGGGITSIGLTTAATNAAGDTKDLTPAEQAAAFLESMKAKVRAIHAFNDDLATLKAKGLSASALQQIAASGLETGGALAKALAAATPQTIRSIDTMQTQIGTSSNQFGKTWAGQMYNTGINAANGILKGLESKRNDLLAMIREMAQAVVNEIKRTLRIKSPSGVMADEVGAMIPAGIAAGMTANAHLVTTAARTLIPANAGAYGSRAAPVAVGKGGDVHVHVHMQNGVVGDAAQVARYLSDVVRRANSQGNSLKFA